MEGRIKYFYVRIRDCNYKTTYENFGSDAIAAEQYASDLVDLGIHAAVYFPRTHKWMEGGHISKSGYVDFTGKIVMDGKTKAAGA